MKRFVVLLAAGLAACGSDDGGGVTPPPPGNYTLVVGDDWQSYNTASLIASGQFGANDSRFSVANNLAIVSDGVFGQVARITQPADPNTGANSGWTVQLTKTFTPLDKVWYRFHARFSPGWTTAGSFPAGAANSYKLAFILWVTYSQRAEIEFSNTTQYIIGFGYQGISCSGAGIAVPGGMTAWPNNVTTEWSGGEWWEYIMYYEKTGATSSRARMWMRQRTQGGSLVNNAFSFSGETKTGCSATVPQARAITLGANKNKVTPTTQYIYWGPYEVVDGSVYPDPFGVGP